MMLTTMYYESLALRFALLLFVVFVTDNDGTLDELRSTPGTDSDIIAQMPEGTEFDVVGEPWCVNGSRWWQIQLTDDTDWLCG